MIGYYVDYQIKVVLRRTKYDLNKAKERAHILEGLIIAVNNIDEVIRIIKTSPDTPTAKQNLKNAFSLSDKQAQAILDLRLARITKLEVFNLKDELDALHKLIAELQAIVDSKKLQKSIVKKEILVIKKKYRDERKTEIVSVEDDISFTAKAASKNNETYIVGVNYNGAVRKVKMSSYKRSAASLTPKNPNSCALRSKPTTIRLFIPLPIKVIAIASTPKAFPTAAGLRAA